MNDNNKSIVLPGFGNREVVRELADRLAKMLPGGLNYTPAEALTLAQISVAHGLDPFNGEVWLIKDNESGKVYGALIGLKGMRKHAKRQSNYWGEFERITAQKDLDAYGIGPNDIGFFYRITDEKTAGAHIDLAERMFKLGYTLEQIQSQLGKPPHTLGIGVFRAGDKTKMRPAHCAMFRAEKDALKRRFDILWSISIDGQEIPIGQNGDEEEPEAEHIEAEYADIEDTTEEPRKPEEIMADLGFGPAKIVGPHVSGKMSLESAMAVQSSEGKAYGDLETSKLTYMHNSIVKKLNLTDLPAAEREPLEYKRDAIETIIAARMSDSAAAGLTAAAG